jgi:hypothetical protein
MRPAKAEEAKAAWVGRYFAEQTRKVKEFHGDVREFRF